MVNRSIDALSRRRLVQRATAAVGGLFAFIALGPQAARADEPCTNRVSAQLQSQSGICQVKWGNPSCSRSCETASSPNGRWYFYYCWICAKPCSGCRPYYMQARVAQHNDGRCSGHGVSAS